MRQLPAGHDWCPECEGDGYHVELGGPAIHTYDAVLPTERKVECGTCEGEGHVLAREEERDEEIDDGPHLCADCERPVQFAGSLCARCMSEGVLDA